MQRHIVIITGSRAEWGLLRTVCQELIERGQRVTVVVTGSHLHSQSGFSGDEVDTLAGCDFVNVYITPEEALESTTGLMMKTISNAFIGLPDALSSLKPDLAVVLGDRYEIFAAATVCRLIGIPLAHISGGELTIGAFDDCLRHCITKLSDLHFAATETYRNRVIQLGETPDRVFNAGELALADLHKTPFKERAELEQMLNISLKEFFLVTVHPETCSPGEGLRIIKILIAILTGHFADIGVVFTGANADPEGDEINQAIAEYVKERGAGCFVRSLGRLNYLSMARLATCVIGNSSSGIIEVPALATPVVDIGRRQLGRPRSEAVISVVAGKEQILSAVKKALKPSFRQQAKNCINPYEGENSARQIAEILSTFDLATISREKHFHDL